MRLNNQFVSLLGLALLCACSSKKSEESSSEKTYNDTTFGTDGKATVDYNSYLDQIFDIQLQSDGKIIVVGTSTDSALGGQGFSIARFTAAGALDTTFATTGKVNSSTASSGVSYAAKILDGGNILVAGTINPTGQSTDFALASYKSDGTLDTSFSSDGITSTAITGTASTDKAFAMGHLKTTASTIIGGYSEFLSVVTFALVKYQADGALESGFGTGGIVTTSFTSGGAKIYGMQVLSDGKIIAVGEASNGTDKDFAIAKYNADGSLDTSFDTDGKLLVDINAKDDTATSIIVDSDGKITIAGLANTSEALYDVALIRLAADGSLDTTFGTNGKTTSSLLGSKINAGINQPLVKMQATSDGKNLFLTGPATAGNGSLFGLLKFSAAGQLDTSFASSGKMTFEWNKGTDHSSSSNALAIDSDGKVLLGGYYYINGTQDFALARFAF